jgi:hypothetical protein
MAKSANIRMAILESIWNNTKISGTDYAKIAWIREDVSRYRREDVDAVLIEMIETGEAIAIPESVQRDLRPQDRKAALRCGGQDKHLITMV